MTKYRKQRPLTSEEHKLILDLLRHGRTYHEIVDQVRRQLGSLTKTCHIAQVKRESGIGTRGAWNTGKRYSLKQ